LLNKLRHRLILSHLLPYLIIIPVIGMALIYLVETQVILTGVASELTEQGVLVAALAQDHPEIWTDHNAAQAFSDEVTPHLNARLMLLDAKGILMGSSDPTDAERFGQSIELMGLDSLSSGRIHINLDYSAHLHADIVDVLIPVMGPDQTVVGAFRLSRSLSDVSERFVHLRYIITGVLAGGLLLTILLGLVLSLNIERPLRKLVETVQRLAYGEEGRLLVEQGPDEIRILQRAVNQLIARLNDLEQLRQRLISNLVHELGRSLGALRAAIQALLRGGSKDPHLEHDLVAGMDEETKQLRRLLDDLANLQDVISGNLELNRYPLDVRKWLLFALRPWEMVAREKGLHWSENIPADLPPIQVDSARLDQALGNLISNAIKFTPTAGNVSISVDGDTQQISIRVQDSGPGIPLEEQERVFIPFYQVSCGNQTSGHGMGLGLSIAQELIVRQGGRILVDSEVGKGSSFTIVLPVSPP
jgi:signal transduction histidine kinase